MAQVVDRWHKTRLYPTEPRCHEHSTKTRPLVASASHGHGDRWQVRYRDPSGKQRKENFPTRPKAETRAAQVVTELDAGRSPYSENKKITFREYAEQWRTAQPHRATTVQRTKTVLDVYAYPTFGDRRIVSVRPSEIQAWLTGLVKVRGLSESTARHASQVVRTVFNAAVRDRIIDRSPCVGTRPVPVPHNEITPLTADQVHALVKAMPDRYQPLIILAVGSGLRPGELFGLEVRHIDFRRRTVKVDQQAQCTQICPPKTEHSYRTVPVPGAALVPIAELLEGTSDGYPTDRVFTNDQGRPIHTSRFNEVWRQAVKDAGLPATTHMHHLRHTYASVLIAAGKGPKTVAARLGDTVAVAMSTYAHLFPDEDADTRTVVGQFLKEAA